MVCFYLVELESCEVIFSVGNMYSASSNGPPCLLFNGNGVGVVVGVAEDTLANWNLLSWVAHP